MEVEAKALEKEAHDHNLQEKLKDFEDEETIPVSHNQENDKEIKHDEVPENPMSTLTPKFLRNQASAVDSEVLRQRRSL